MGGGGGGRLFEVGANSRLGAYSNKYGNQTFQDSSWRRSVEELICNGARIIDVRQGRSVLYSAVELWKKKKEKKQSACIDCSLFKPIQNILELVFQILINV